MRKIFGIVLVFAIVLVSVQSVVWAYAGTVASNRQVVNNETLTSGGYVAVAKKSGINIRKNLINDLEEGFSDVNRKYDGRLNPELMYHGEFYAEIPGSKLSYIFYGYDPDFNYKLKDDSPCIRIEGRLKDVFTGTKKKMSVKNFAKALKKNYYNVKYKICEGAGTSYYIGDIYAEITFKLKESDKAAYGVNILLESKKSSVNSDSFTWLFKQ